MGLGGYPATDKQFLGMLGMHGTYEANMAMHHCDVLIAIGARFDDRVTGNVQKFCPTAEIVHVAIDTSSISKNVKVDVPRRWINSGGLGTMGFGLPAAMGVQLAHPDATVACVTGEGSIQMCIQELSTCLQYQLPIKVINLNNRYLGMVRQWQEFFYQGRYAMSYMDSLTDFVKLAEAYGHVGMLIQKPSDVEGALREAMAMKNRLVFLDFITDQIEIVYPMIPAGAGLNEMILV